MGLLVSLVVAVVFFSIFIHRAASNVRALGRAGMEYTPGWCVGWFFVPFANLVRPYRAVAEVWRSSDPDAAAGSDWMGSPSVPALFSFWWATWILHGVISNVSGRIDEPAASGAVGLVGTGFMIACAVACITIMRQIAARQSAAAARMAAVPYSNG